MVASRCEPRFFPPVSNSLPPVSPTRTPACSSCVGPDKLLSTEALEEKRSKPLALDIHDRFAPAVGNELAEEDGTEAGGEGGARRRLEPDDATVASPASPASFSPGRTKTFHPSSLPSKALTEAREAGRREG